MLWIGTLVACELFIYSVDNNLFVEIPYRCFYGQYVLHEYLAAITHYTHNILG